MTEQDAALVRILAATDAVWKPMRQEDWVRPTPTVLYEHRTRFASKGVPWHSGDPTEAGRKASQRTLEDLASAGLLTLHGRERRAAVRLTEKGDIVARALADLPNVDDAHSSLREVIRLESSGDGQGPMASELWLAELPNYSNNDDCYLELWIVQRLLLPALWRGWIDADSDCCGRVYYSATADGRQLAKLPPPTLPANLPPPDEDAAELYDSEVIAARERLRQAKPDCAGEIGYLPLPASIDIRPRVRRKRRSCTA
jgi:hypothetical protein